MFKKISHNKLKNCQNLVRNTKNQTLFSVSLPLFKNNFWKVTYSTVSTVGVIVPEAKPSGKAPHAFNGVLALGRVSTSSTTRRGFCLGAV